MRVGVVVELSERERDFVFHLAHGLRPTRAATEAGYAIGSARNLLRKPHVRAAIEAVAKNTSGLLAKLERADAAGEQGA
jgi:phage terminase small subunit